MNLWLYQFKAEDMDENPIKSLRKPAKKGKMANQNKYKSKFWSNFVIIWSILSVIYSIIVVDGKAGAKIKILLLPIIALNLGR